MGSGSQVHRMMGRTRCILPRRLDFSGSLMVGYKDEPCPTKVGCGFADIFPDVL